MTRQLAALLALSLLSACASPAPESPAPAAAPAQNAAAHRTGPLPREDSWRSLLAGSPGQETLDFCIALAGQGETAIEQASGRACLANIALLGCPEGEKARCADAALQQLEMAIDLAPEARRLHLGRLRVLLDADRAGELAPALLDSFERRATDATDLPVWLGYAVELLETKRLRAAAAYMESLRTRFPDDPQVLATLGACLTDLSRHDRAREVLAHGIAVAPDDPTMNWAMAWHHPRAGRTPSARAYFDVAIANAPDEPTLNAWGCDYGRMLERSAVLERACELQQAHCSDGVSSLCAGRIGRR